MYVEVTDAAGNKVKSAGITVTVTKPVDNLKATAKVSATSVSKGGTVKITATATGGAGSYKYSYIVKNTTTGKWSRLKDNSTSNTYTWTAGSTGTRVFYVDVTDKNGKTVRTEGLTVKTIDNPLKATSKVNATNVSIGGTVNITATATGGAGS